MFELVDTVVFEIGAEVVFARPLKHSKPVCVTVYIVIHCECNPVSNGSVQMGTKSAFLP